MLESQQPVFSLALGLALAEICEGRKGERNFGFEAAAVVFVTLARSKIAERPQTPIGLILQECAETLAAGAQSIRETESLEKALMN